MATRSRAGQVIEGKPTRRPRKLGMPADNGTSPELSTSSSKKRGRSTEETLPAGKRMATDPIMQAIKGLTERFDARFDKVSTREDLSKIMTHVQANSNEIALVKKKQSQYRANFRADVERVVDGRLAEARANHTGHTALTPEETQKEKDYMRARRSMRAWPIKLTNKDSTHIVAFKEFCIAVLQVPKDRVIKLENEETIAVDPTRRLQMK